MSLPENYRWQENEDGTFTVFDVEVFAKCVREVKDPRTGKVVKRIEYDDDWIRDAMKNGRAEFADRGSLPPMQLHHEGPANPIPRWAGPWELTRYDGQFVYANLTFTNREAFREVLEKRWLYRSVHTDYEGRRFRALSLLDSLPSFHKFPLLTLREGADVALATNQFGEATGVPESGRPLVAFSEDGEHETLLLELPPMTVEVEEVKPEAEAFADAPAGKGGKDPKTEAEEVAGPEAKKAETTEPQQMGEETEGGVSGELKDVIKAMVANAVKEALAEMAGGDDATEETKPAAAEPARQGPPEVMSEETTPSGDASKFAELQAKFDALEVKLDESAKAATFKEALAECEGMLTDRITGASLREKLTKFAEDHGVEAMKDYAEQLKEQLPPVSGNDTQPETFGDLPKGQDPEWVDKFRGDPALFSDIQAGRRAWRESGSDLDEEDFVGLYVNDTDEHFDAPAFGGVRPNS